MQHVNQNRIIVETTELTPSIKKKDIKVLHVDDELSLLEVSKQILTLENNFEIENATSVDEAFKKMEKQQYDAIISDYEMPQKNGLDFLKELRAQNNTIPFILFTGKGREDIAVKALNLGADSYVDKNGSPETVYCELADIINKTVERKKSRELLAKSESKYHALVENSLQGIAILQTAPIRLAFANGAFGKILDYSPEELMSLSPEEIMSLVYHEDRAVFFKRMENRLRGEPAGVSFEFRALRKDGSTIWLSSLANRVDYDGQPAVQGMFLDINESKKTAEILFESEQRYRELANCLPDIVFETDLNGQLEFANERAAEISGYSLNEIEKGTNIFQFIAPEDRDRATKTIQHLLSGGNYVPSEYKFTRKDGTTFPALITATPRISQNKMTGLRGLVIDITERKKAEDSLKESEEKFRTLSEQSPNMIFINKQGKVVYTNKKCEDTMGYTKKEFYSPSFDFLSLCAPECVEEVKLFYAKQMSGEAVASYECVLVTREGERINAIITTNVIEYEGEKAVLGIITDITERKKAEEVLRKSEESFRSLINSMDDLVFVLGFDGIFKNYHQSSHKKELFAAPEEFVGKHFVQVLPPKVAELCQAAMKRIEDSGETQEFDYDLEMNDEKAWYNARFSPTKDQSGRKTSVTVVVRNITEQKKAEFKLKQYNEILERVGEGVDAGLAVINRDYSVVWANKRLMDLGVAPNKKCYETFNNLGIVCPNCGVEKIFKNNASLDVHEYKTVNSKGETIWIELRVTPLKDQNGVTMAALELGVPITERKKMEQFLRESEEKFRKLFETSPDACYIGTLEEGVIIEINDAFSRTWGYSKEECIGKTSLQLGLYSKGAPDRQRMLSELKSKGHFSYLKFDGKRKNGEVFPLLFSGSTLEINGKRLIYGILRDISEQKRAEEELKKKSAKMEIINEKLNVVGRLTRHDVGNKLMVMKSNIYLLKKQIGDNSKLTNYVKDIEASIDQSAAIFEFSHFYEKIGVEELSKINVAQCFNHAVTLLPNLGTTKIVNSCQGLEVMADSLLKQLFYNFLDNTLKHGEKVTLIRLHYTMEGDGVKLFYEDDGVGIPEAIKEKLFTEGFSTGKSTGLGLFLIKKMIDVYGWKIEENGEPGKGAKFVITIPKLNKNGKEND